MIGRELSHFRVLEKIGSGGMGIVYRAQDLRLGRAVAIKVMPPDALGDRERRERFAPRFEPRGAWGRPSSVGARPPWQPGQ